MAIAVTLLPPLLGALVGAFVGGRDVTMAAGLAGAGLCLGAALAVVLRPRLAPLPARVGRFDTRLASVVIASGAAAAISIAAWSSWRGPQTLSPGERLRSADYIELRGTPHLRYIYRSTAGLYRFPLREHDAHLLVELDHEPRAVPQRFRGSLAPSLVGGLMNKSEGYFAGAYARQRKLRGTIYLLRASRALSPAILGWAGAGALCVLGLVLLFRRAARAAR